MESDLADLTPTTEEQEEIDKILAETDNSNFKEKVDYLEEKGYFEDGQELDPFAWRFRKKRLVAVLYRDRRDGRLEIKTENSDITTVSDILKCSHFPDY